VWQGRCISGAPKKTRHWQNTHPGIPLSWFCGSKSLALVFILVVNPIACLVGAICLAATGSSASCFGDPQEAGTSGSSSSTSIKQPSGRKSSGKGSGSGRPTTSALYRELLLSPSHWLATWRLNCVLVAWHAAVGGAPRDYALEDKAAFLLEADRLGLPVAPFVKAPRVFVKHRSVEGGQVGSGAACWVVGVVCCCCVCRFYGGGLELLWLAPLHTHTHHPQSECSTLPPTTSPTTSPTTRVSTCTTTSLRGGTGSCQRHSTTRRA